MNGTTGSGDIQPLLCRLCGGDLRERFRLTVLGRHDVGYHECVQCGSLQTDPPFWLAEAYGCNLASLDTGALQRNLTNFAACLTVVRLFGLQTAVDYGGGDGMLCRFLRDHGIDAYSCDRYAQPVYAQGFTDPSFSFPDFLTAFEVLEHLPDPAADLADIFTWNPKVVLLTTELFSGQGSDWWYLAPQSGQHVFFYSPKAVLLIAEKYGYMAVQMGGYLLFVRNDFPARVEKAVAAREILGSWVLQAVKSYIFTQPTPGVGRDYALMREILDKPHLEPPIPPRDEENGGGLT